MSLVCCQLHLSHLVNLTHDLHFCFLVFVLVIFNPPPFISLVSIVFGFKLFFVCWSGIFLCVCFPVAFSSRSHVECVCQANYRTFCHFSKIVLCFWFCSVFSFLNLELFVTVPLFKSSLKKNRAILSETSGQRKLVCWCWGRTKRLTWPSKNPKNYPNVIFTYLHTLVSVMTTFHQLDMLL